MRILTAATFMTFLLGVSFEASALDPKSNPQFRNYEAPENLESKHNLECVDSAQVQNKYTPTDLYRAMAKCIDAGKYRDGAFLFAIAGVYGRYDSFRVTDKTAHQAVTVARFNALGQLSQEKEAAFKEGVMKTLGNPEGLAATCKEIQRIGAPDYHPRYMIQHGMGAFNKTGTDGDLVKDFDAKASWKKALDTYLHCPGL